MRVLLVMNPKAGGSSSNLADLFQRSSRKSGHHVEIAVPFSHEESDALIREAIASGCERIICAGGDGSINHIASILAGTDIPLAIIPTGTANVLARELRLPFDPQKALDTALQGSVRRIDIGWANNRSFLLMAGLGFDAKVVAEIIPQVKGLLGPFAYVTTGLQMLTNYKPSQFQLVVDGESISLPAWLVVVGNAGYYGFQVTVTPGARLDSGMLDVCLFAEHNVLDRLTQIGAVFAGGMHVKHPNVRYLRASKLKITADPPVHVQLDGDPSGFSPVDIIIQPSALNIVTAK